MREVKTLPDNAKFLDKIEITYAGREYKIFTDGKVFYLVEKVYERQTIHKTKSIKTILKYLKDIAKGFGDAQLLTYLNYCFICRLLGLDKRDEM